MNPRARFSLLSITSLASATLSFAALAGPILSAQTGTSSMDSMPGTESKKPAAPPSTGISLTIDGKTSSYTVAELSALPQKTVKVHNEHTRADESYTGVSLADLLAKGGLSVSSAGHAKLLRSYVQAEGTDHYWVLYSLVEIEPSEHAGDVVVATSVDGHELGADGQLKLVSTEDRKPERWVRNLAAITVKLAQ